jgi:hypothetical protein
MAANAQDLSRDQAIAEESRRIRRLQLTVRLVMSVISQSDLPFEEASKMVAATRQVALNLFPGKEEAYDLLYQPRLQRLLAQTYRLH